MHCVEGLGLKSSTMLMTCYSTSFSDDMVFCCLPELLHCVVWDCIVINFSLSVIALTISNTPVIFFQVKEHDSCLVQLKTLWFKKAYSRCCPVWMGNN